MCACEHWQLAFLTVGVWLLPARSLAFNIGILIDAIVSALDQSFLSDILTSWLGIIETVRQVVILKQ